MLDQLTPRAQQYERNPFEHHPLLTPTRTTFNQNESLTPLQLSTATTQLSLNAPVFSMQLHLPDKALKSRHSSPPSSSSALGQIHVKLIQARGLNIPPPFTARPYVVVQFEQNEFVSRDPVASDSASEIRGVATPTSSTPSVSTTAALNALGALAARSASRPSSRKGSASSHGSERTLPTSLFATIQPANPVWKHEVSFDVTSSDSLITFSIFDRQQEEAHDSTAFLGYVQIKPVLVNDRTIDDWYRLHSYDDNHFKVTGEMRVQITFEANKNKRSLTPKDFEFLKLIGKGTFGTVFQVRKRDTKRIYAMKVLSKKEIVARKEVAHTIGERKILQQSLECPFLVGLKFSFQTKEELYLVTDFKSGGELFWHLQRETKFTEERSRFYIAELVLALEHLHRYDIIYRDLKPENILLDATGHIALCDFGLSKPDIPANELTTTFCGTTEYLAPEILLDEHGYSKVVDFWSLGVLLFEMCCGWSPFYAEDTQAMYNNICFGKIRFPKGVIGDDGKAFVKGLLNRNPKNRLGAHRDAVELKEHPFLKAIDWHALSLKQVTPPFKPVVESDESTNYFDPEFTNANMDELKRGVGGKWIDEQEAEAQLHNGVADADDDWMDEDDPSGDWVDSDSTSSQIHYHTPHGPLGSDTRASRGLGRYGSYKSQGGGPLTPMNSLGKEKGSKVNGVVRKKSGKGVNGNGTARTNKSAPSNGQSNGHTTNGTGTSGTAQKTKGIEIKSSKKPPAQSRMAESLLSNSVQEKFKGFTYEGESLVAPPGVLERARMMEEEAHAQKQGKGSHTGESSEDSEFEDFGKSAGRYAKARRKGLGFTDMDEC